MKRGIINELSAHYLGFLSANNNKIIMRDITDSGYFGRYYKLTLNPNNFSIGSFYSLMSQFNLLYTDAIDINIAEGTFDILSIYLNLSSNKKENQLYFASCGFNFPTIIKYLISQGITTEINLHIYADNDKSDLEIKNQFKNIFYTIWIDNIFIHRNIYPGEKDFGISKDHIDEKIYKINL